MPTTLSTNLVIAIARTGICASITMTISSSGRQRAAGLPKGRALERCEICRIDLVPR
jgi:hypothetical protein